MVPPCSDRVSRAPPYSRIQQDLRLRGYHPLRPAFPCRSASTCWTTGLLRVRSPLLAESRLMSVPPGTEMFQFPGFASSTYVFSERYPKGVGCPIRTPRDQSLLAAPPGFSQRATSFIASWCQGIHRMPFSCSIHPYTEPTRAKARALTSHGSTPQPQFVPVAEQILNNTHTHTYTPLNPATHPRSADHDPSQNHHRHGSDNHADASRTPRHRPSHEAGPQTHPVQGKQPSCPARPGAHQNLIHM